MSLIKAIMHQLGLSGDPAKNFTLSVPAAPDGTMKLARGNAGATTQDIMTVDAAGKVKFPQNSIPAFSAIVNAQAVGVSLTILTCTEIFDPLNQFVDNKFTPQVAGLYQVNANIKTNQPDAFAIIRPRLNGSEFAIASGRGLSAAEGNGSFVSTCALVRMNGTTDYLDLAALITVAGYSVTGGSFSACLVRAD